MSDLLNLVSTSAHHLIPLIQIIGIDVVLSGDNAVVIALAARSLPPAQKKQAVFFGAAAAIAMRVLLTLTAVALLTLPYLKLIGSLLLLWIGIQLLDEDDDEPEITSGHSLASAIRTIVMADVVMSLDNVLGIAAVAKGNVALLVIGLAISIPFIITGSRILLRVMEHFPIIIAVGAALLGYVAGEMAVSDPAVAGWIEQQLPVLHRVVPVVCAVFVLVAAKLRKIRRSA